MDCPKCKTKCADRERFCPVCGETLSGAATQGSEVPVKCPVPVPEMPAEPPRETGAAQTTEPRRDEQKPQTPLTPQQAFNRYYGKDSSDPNSGIISEQYSQKTRAAIDTVLFFLITIPISIAGVISLRAELSTKYTASEISAYWWLILLAGVIVGTFTGFMISGFRTITKSYWSAVKELWSSITDSCMGTILAWLLLGIIFWTLAFAFWLTGAYFVGIFKGLYPVINNIATLFDEVARTNEDYYALEAKRSKRKKILIGVWAGVFILLITVLIIFS